jgi:hypothetical protein
MLRRTVDPVPRAITGLVLVVLLVSACVTEAGSSASDATSSSAGASSLPAATSEPVISGGSVGPGSTASVGSIGPGATSSSTTVVPVTNPPDGSIPPAPSFPEPGLEVPDDVAQRIRIVDTVGAVLYCDRDLYPIAREDEQVLAEHHLAEMQANAGVYLVIAAHLQVNDPDHPTAEQVLAIYREWKMLVALPLQKTGGGFAFDYTADVAGQPTHVAGTLDPSGTISVTVREASQPPPCPICLTRGTRIDTPNGLVPVEEIRAGDIVWTLDAGERKVAAPVLRIGSTPVPATHAVVRLGLADGRSVVVSPGHPLSDGRLVGAVRAGDIVDGSRVVRVERIAYDGGATFDLLPDGATGTYWADGILLRSTLR